MEQPEKKVRKEEAKRIEQAANKEETKDVVARRNLERVLDEIQQLLGLVGSKAKRAIKPKMKTKRVSTRRRPASAENIISGECEPKHSSSSLLKREQRSQDDLKSIQFERPPDRFPRGFGVISEMN